MFYIKHTVLFVDGFVGQLSRTAYVVTCLLLLVFLATESRSFAFAPLQRVTGAAQRHKTHIFKAILLFSSLLAISILASQLDPIWHLSLRHFFAVVLGAALFSLLLQRSLPALDKKKAAIPLLIAPVIASMTAWTPEATWLSFILFLAVFPILSFGILLLLETKIGVNLSRTAFALALGGVLAVMTLVYLCLCVNVETWRPYVGEIALHWGIFINGAQIFLNNLIPLYDAPAQYGLGPSLLIYPFCSGGSCWSGLYVLLVLLYPLYFGLLNFAYGCAWPDASRALKLLFLLLAFLSLFFWNSAGPFLPLLVPSTGPLQFLPLLLMSVLTLRGHVRAAYALFAISIWWAPDAAVMSGMALFFPECTARGAKGAAWRLAATMAISVLAGSLIFWLIYRQVPDPTVYAEYLIHPPGIVPPDFFGSVWIFFVSLGLAVTAITVSQTPDEMRDSAAIAGAAVASLLYFLSRSLSENINNLLPFIVLLFLRVCWLYRTRQSWRIAGATFFGLLLSGIVFAVPTAPAKAMVNYHLESIFRDERNAEAALLGGIDTAQFGIVLVPRDEAISLLPLKRWGLLDSMGAWYPIPKARQQLYTARSWAKMPDHRPAACFVSPKNWYFEIIIEGYLSTYDIVSKHDLGSSMRYGLRRKDAPVGQDPCGPQRPAASTG